MQIDETNIRMMVAHMKKNNQLFECRILFDNKKILSGYFKGADTLITELKKINLSNASVYFTLQEINEACYSRSQQNHFEDRSKTTTSDNDVVRYQWLFIDLDPKRPAGTSSSNDELEKAKVLGNNIYLFLENIGFSKPITALSGNGVHLLYRIDLKNTPENVQIVKGCLQTLNMLFSNDSIDVDMKNFNASRICKLYGTMATKGVSTEDRPHRLSQIAHIPNNLTVTDASYLKKLVDMQPKLDEPKKYNNYNPKEFDIEEWMNKYNIGYRTTSWSDGIKYVLDCCPFDSNHNGKDACLFVSRSGAIGFNCFHNSCSGKTWKDVRLLYEPNAYESREKTYEDRIYSQRNKDGVKAVEKPKKYIKEEEGKPVFMSALDIFNLPKEEEVYVKTGIKELDRRMRGLQKGYVTLVTGASGSAKSTLLSQLAINSVQEGNRVCVFSGELSNKNYMKWTNLQAAGKNKVSTTGYYNYFTVDVKYQKMIAEWLDGKFWLYNNDYGNNFNAIIDKCEKIVVDKKIDLLILDNLMAFDTGELGYTQNEIDTAFIWALKSFATRTNIHIVFVAHPRKTISFLRPEDVSGSANLRNATDNMLIVHRIDNDFKRKATEMFGWKWDMENDANPVFGATNCIEICKDRDGTNRDVFIPLWYEIETKRLKNDKSENIVYGWNEGSMDGYIEFAFGKLPEDEETPFD